MTFYAKKWNRIALGLPETKFFERVSSWVWSASLHQKFRRGRPAGRLVLGQTKQHGQAGALTADDRDLLKLKREKRELKRVNEILRLFDDGTQRYGAPKVWDARKREDRTFLKPLMFKAEDTNAPKKENPTPLGSWV